MICKTIWVIGFLIIFYHSRAAAQADTVIYTLQAQAVTAHKDYLPQWIISNRFGVFKDDTDALLGAAFQLPYHRDKRFDFSLGLNMVGKTEADNSFIQEAYLKLRYGVLEFRGGRIKETTGLPNDALSSGSLAQSRNARPITKIALTFPEYVDVPFTNGYFEIKGYFGHGWLEENRKIRKPYLHEKSIYGRFGGSLPVKAYIGFVHYALWGGTDSNPKGGKRPSRLKDYLRILVGEEALRDDANPSGLESGNALGSHLGIYDLGIAADIKDWQLMLYNQVPYEDGSSLNIFRNRDRLLGLSLTAKDTKKKRIVSEVTYEYIHTTYQSGPGIPDKRPGDQDNYGYPYGGRDETYNNGMYQTGWTYKGMIIGTPLFMTNDRAAHFFSDLEDHDYKIVNNRIVGHHLGAKGQVGNIFQYRVLATYTRNYGTYSGLNQGRYKWASMDPDSQFDYAFNPPLDQYYLLLEVNTRLPFTDGLSLQTAVGCDIGEIGDNTGILLGLTYDGLMRFGREE